MLRVTDVVTRTCYVLPKCSPVVTRTKVTQVFGVGVTFVLPDVLPHTLTRTCYVLPRCSPVVTRTFVIQMFTFRKRIWYVTSPPWTCDGPVTRSRHHRPSISSPDHAVRNLDSQNKRSRQSRRLGALFNGRSLKKVVITLVTSRPSKTPFYCTDREQLGRLGVRSPPVPLNPVKSP